MDVAIMGEEEDGFKSTNTKGDVWFFSGLTE